MYDDGQGGWEGRKKKEEDDELNSTEGDVKSLEGEQAQQGRLRVPDRPYLTGSRMSWPALLARGSLGLSWVVPGSRLDQGWVRRCHCLGQAWSGTVWHPVPCRKKA
jgi:hypothetical protein